MRYRREIDGLRAVAVLPVILFHAGFSVFSGGYVGVDVFFVISGYLITSILIAELEQGNFSIARFYERRARRILPALFVVMLACLPFAYMWMLPSQLKDFAQSLIAVVFFASNVLFWREDGYFAAAAELKPMLHTWSLAVEEQYYLLFPILLLVLWRFGRRRAFWGVVALALLSLMLSEWGQRNKPSANFYLAPTRAWETLAGSICTFITVGKAQRLSNLLGAIGLALIVFAIFAYDANTPFPSVYALIPVVGTALIILYGTTGTWVARLLSLRGFVGIGLISYSAYLWHQPLFAFARLRSLTEPSNALMAVLAAASLLLAWVTWCWVEQAFRKRANPLFIVRRSVFALSGGISAAFVVVGLAGHIGNGFEWRFDVNHDFLAYFENEPPNHSFLHKVDMFTPYRDNCNFFIHSVDNYAGTKADIPENCYTKPSNELPTLFVWGDSHAQQLNYGLEVALQGRWNILQVASSGCKPALPSTKITPMCDKSNKTALTAMRNNKPDVLIVGYVGMWEHEELENLVKYLHNNGIKKVLVSGPVPRWKPSLPWQMAIRWDSVPRRTWVGIDQDYVDYNERFISEGDFNIDGVVKLNLMSALCNVDGCLTYIGEDKKEGITSFDYGHLMPMASKIVAERVILPALNY